MDTETPKKGKMFGWDKCFQQIISRHKCWMEAEHRKPARLPERTYPKDSIEIVFVHLKKLDSHEVS